MALTPSNMLPLGTKGPNFTLPDTISGRELSLYKKLRGEKGTLIIFSCNHCPFVIHVIEEIVNIAKIYASKGISSVMISANDVITHPQDSPENMKIFAQKYVFTFPYLYDESQQVAKAYDAACTPDFYLFDEQMQCIYRGQLDEARPGNDIAITGKDLRKAMDYLLAHKTLDFNQKPSLGCSIKWKTKKQLPKHFY